MDYINNMNFTNNEEYFEEIYPNIWIMDNHKWSLYCWEQYREENDIPSILVHLDYHWDAINDYHEDESIIKKMNLVTMKDVLIKEDYIRKDSFIAPSIIRGYINRVDFHCFQTDTEIGLDESLLANYNVEQNIHDKIGDLINSIGNKKIILDLDLDIFNKSDNFLEGDLWSEEEIKNYIYKITPLIEQAKVITIAMSYGFSGSDQGREYLTKLVTPIIVDISGKYNKSLERNI
ncbi:MAG: UPF0489 family protein [Sulfurimonas sp.]|uniref:UPF0489 family protein n=1 Tax=Sulfurimonas sp. TaxID=2022749 RepID=UPI003D13C49D